MLKRKYGDRSDWPRILERRYAQTFMESKEFTGYVTLLQTVKVAEPLFVYYEGRRICIVDDGYLWLQQFPKGENHALTTMFDSKGEVVQWYVDISLENGAEGDVPWIDDLFLDVIKLPTGELILKDKDELEQALSEGIINQNLYELAWKEARTVIELIRNNEFNLLNLSSLHKDALLPKLN
ncbi:DUF402 domain-containing protein [Jeotgalibacillus proteolyticus]|uniref:DUF402 domain-containing protein n=1 Tax=Jeotgalibacillus proteolyticus TaxID=2082395 RepID=A0A2S5GBD9_9BACL|nr:DUF402 domain-containing protein [Jeotgalibacillus proteolyticus]PPA70357.1 DUF402 domain-containing protein [Jeotgalibacillus proteolyticus]